MPKPSIRGRSSSGSSRGGITARDPRPSVTRPPSSSGNARSRGGSIARPPGGKSGSSSRGAEPGRRTYRPGGNSLSDGLRSYRSPSTGEGRSARIPDAGGYNSDFSPSSRGTIERRMPLDTTNPRIPDVNSARYGYGDRNPYGGKSAEFLPPPPPPPVLGDHYGGHYWRNLRHHYDRYADHWFGGHYSWRRFIHGCQPAPWFWSHYHQVYTWPWVFGYYEPRVYTSFGWWTPRWYGHIYYPWWSWCDAPFVYFYYRYPARFSFHLSLNSDYYYDDYYYDDYYDDAYDVAYYDIYDGGASLVVTALDRPLGIWVPGHWEQRYYVDSEWVWVPGYYTY